jgi:hypothetical protein
MEGEASRILMDEDLTPVRKVQEEETAAEAEEESSEKTE